MSVEDTEVYDPLDEYITGKSHPLIEASKGGDYERLVALLEEFQAKGKPLRLIDNSGWQAVHYATKHSDTACLSVLLKLDDSLVHEKTHEGNTPLIIAAGLGNTEAVRVIMPFLQCESIQVRNLHGLNALYYAAVCNTEKGNEIAIQLLQMDKSESHISCRSTFDTLPFRVIKNKNAKLLSAVLDAGLDISYDASLESDFRDEDFAADFVPITLMGYCVEMRWTDGLQMLVSATKKRIAKQQSRHDIISIVCSHFTSPKFGCYGTGVFFTSAWSMIFTSGYKEGLDIMLQENIISPAMFPITFDGLIGKSLEFPLSLVLQDDIRLKKDFLEHFLTIQSCDDFQEHFKKAFLSDVAKLCENDEHQREKRQWILDNWQYITIHGVPRHPLAIFVSTLNCNKNFSIEEHIDLLIECGFTFDFEVPIYYHHGISWQNTVETLLALFQYPAVCKVVSALLSRPLNLPITIDAIVGACVLTSWPECVGTASGDDLYPWPHLLLMKFLSQRPVSEIKQVYNRWLHLVPSEQESRWSLNNPECRIVDRLPPYDCHWLAAVQVLIKGIHVCLGDQSCLVSWKRVHGNNEIPFSLYFLCDNDRNNFLESGFNSREDPYEKKMKALKISSLQALCRTVVRNHLGYRLIREPVPRCESTPDVIDVDDSWEVSSIAQLPIPKMLQDYLRFKPEIQEYAQYLGLCTWAISPGTNR